MLTFQRFSEINRLRNALHFPDCAKWEEAHWGNALAGEAGELCNIIKKRHRGWKESDNISDEEVGKEIADIICYCDLLAGKIGKNLADIVTQKFNEVSDRYDCDIKL
jgi:NTP pyrophosphatase (non-canonical NTP hydrolase)